MLNLLNVKPKYDDRKIRSVINQSIVSQAILVAHEIGLFEVIGQHRKTLEEICALLSLPFKSAFALLVLCIQNELITQIDLDYELTDYAKEYLLKESPFYFGPILNLIIEQNQVRSYTSIKESLLSDQPSVYQGRGLFETHEQEKILLERFAAAMHAKSLGCASAWPEWIDLSYHQVFLDIGGSIGTHVLCACKKWEHLKGIIYERPAVCTLAEDYIQCYQMENRITTWSGDMWKDPFPQSDVHFYSDIFHDWPPEKACFLSKKSFDNLPAGGKIILHEMLLNPQEADAQNAAAYNLNMLLWTQGQQFSRDELQSTLEEAGFVKIQAQKTFGDWSIIFGEKP